MKRNLFTLFFCIAALSGLNRAEAQAVVMPHVGYDFDMESFFLGVGTEFNIGVEDLPFGLAIRPSAEYYLGESESETFMGTTYSASSSALQFNGDLIAEFVPATEGIGFYGGAGLAVTMFRYSVDMPGMGSDSDTNTELGLNLLGGAQFGVGGLAPFVQARLTTPGTTRLQVMGGLRISL